MKSNSYFSFQRFWILLRNDILLNYKKYLLTIGGAFIVIFIVLFMSMPNAQYERHFVGSSYITPFLICLIGLSAFIGMAFPAFSNKTDTLNYLLQPASTFEKFLSQFIIRVVIGIMIFLLIFWIDAYLARAAAQIALRKFPSYPQIEAFQFSYLFSGYKNAFLGYLAYLSAGIFLFSVRLFFRKMGLIKTALALAGTVLSVMLLMTIFSHIFFPDTVGLNIQIDAYTVYKDFQNLEIFFISISNLSLLFFLPLGYFKLKEKQL